MPEEKILKKIQNLLDLANNNPSEEEAIAASLKAQELMAKYDIELGDLNDDVKEIIEEVYYDDGKHEMKKWKYRLANTVAKNYKCKNYILNKKNIVFYGHTSDAKIALSVFTYLYKTGIRLANNYYYNKKKMGYPTKGLMNSYLLGFVNGIESKLDEQCTALMIIVPPDVNDAYEIMSKNFEVKHTSYKVIDSEAYNKGQTDGKETIDARKLEEK